MKFMVRCCAVLIPLVTLMPLRVEGDERIEFNRDIRPILSDKCFHCHGPNAESRQADLRLDVADDEMGPFREQFGYQVIKPGDLEDSLLWSRVTSDDEYEVMPPADSNKEPLTVAQQTLIKRWILEGAEYQNFWAFMPPVDPQLPDVDYDGWNRSPIDRFVMARLQQEGLTPEPAADKRTLIRRLTFDLTGLPPTRDEIRRFLNDSSDQAYERLVDDLLARPQYGEHMARYWLDLVRFADTNGIHHDHYREMTPYRDWVIQSFNRNLPFDKFITDQLAGDLYANPTLDQQIASGFNRLHLVIDKGTALPEESYVRNVVDRVTAVGTAFLGLTVECAACHDHKYDPLTQREFYQLFAFFNNIDADPETPGQGVHAPFVRVPTSEQRDRLSSLETQISSLSARIPQMQDAAAPSAPANHDSTEVNVGQQTEASTASTTRLAEQQLTDLKEDKKKLLAEIPVTLVMKERQEIRPAHILIRGAYDQPGEQVVRNTPAFLPAMKQTGDTKTRMDLARWLTDRQHPLTARVTVNRFWQQFFGVGLVKTSEDFGAQGAWPSHPDLLDDLTIEFLASQWDVKALVKSMVMSQAYRQSASAPTSKFQQDPENRLLARGSRFRMDAEVVRDQVLAVSGLLNPAMYGPSVKPPQPPDLWKSVSMVSSSTYSFQPDTGDKIYRRSVYTFWKRAMPPPQLTIFDAPTRESCIARRERTNTPLQALVLMNEVQNFQAARHYAQRLLANNQINDQQRLVRAYEAVTSHQPDLDELNALLTGLNDLRLLYQQDVEAARAMTSDVSEANDQQRINLAAHTMLVNSLFNLDVTKTRE